MSKLLAEMTLEQLWTLFPIVLTAHNPEWKHWYEEESMRIRKFLSKVFHLHLRYEGDCDEIYFCDYMNGHPELAKKYEQLKLSLWKEYEHNRDGYTEAKTEFIRYYTECAKSEGKRNYVF